MKNKDRNTKASDENNEFDIFVLYEESEPDISSKTKRKTPNKYCEWTKKIFSTYIVPGLTLSAMLGTIGTVVSNHISQQRYYDELVDKYIASMEKLLIEDTFHYKYLKSLDKKENTNTALSPDELRYKHEYNQVKSLALSVTENALRSLSKDDGFCIPLPKLEKPFWNCRYIGQNNPERRQFVVSFLDQAGLGFKSIFDPKIRRGQQWESFLEEINLGALERNRGLNLERIMLPRAILKKANFTEADLKKAFLSSTDLTDARLIDANLSGAYLIDANLSGAYLIDANLSGAYLIDAKLPNANFTDANLTNADLTNADLTNADLTRANLTRAKGAVINQAKLCNTILPNGKISGCPKNDL
ncbi:pentapeptide repeat protein [Richelia sinica FACHB-800]|uniref:Pentapeptide repeat protein n=1 Tax=Richelia sinica FACHB-800 TaxID=1357546 RepID=A0A975TC04_9NOST|nr:pentapeptide repeat-containing protein [Richelia sinica]MBD2665672.1 pentapeptide repeat-containing protein [Richelia sinica FACHB-800]QXE25809.1 pentapeptide repeat protein [Richelia sinica FACHB-800]